jgi:hypothetical protein
MQQSLYPNNIETAQISFMQGRHASNERSSMHAMFSTKFWQARNYYAFENKTDKERS